MKDMDDAPQDGTVILLLHWPYHYKSRRIRGSDFGGWERTPEPVWIEARWVSDQERTGSAPHWQEYTGDPKCNSSHHVDPKDAIGWANLPSREVYYPAGYYYFKSERSSSRSIAQKIGERWFVIGEFHPNGLELTQLIMRGWDIDEEVIP